VSTSFIASSYTRTVKTHATNTISCQAYLKPPPFIKTNTLYSTSHSAYLRCLLPPTRAQAMTYVNNVLSCQAYLKPLLSSKQTLYSTSQSAYLRRFFPTPTRAQAMTYVNNVLSCQAYLKPPPALPALSADQQASDTGYAALQLHAAMVADMQSGLKVTWSPERLQVWVVRREGLERGVFIFVCIKVQVCIGG